MTEAENNTVIELPLEQPPIFINNWSTSSAKSSKANAMEKLRTQLAQRFIKSFNQN